jgi:pimeloyl-ACP methyl ester carboxylesterase
MRSSRFWLSGVAAAVLLAGCASTSSPPDLSTPIAERAAVLGATDLSSAPGPDGGVILNGKLDGRPFVLATPNAWNGGAVFFAQGYSTPGATPVVPEDPIAKDPGGGSLTHIYGQGYAVAISAYDKAGVATESGVANTIRLRDFVNRLGANRDYILGGSMGGGVVVAALETHPQAFDGAVSMCGVTEGWTPLIGQLTELRAAYNLLTEGTPYALPGEHDVTRSGLPTVPPAGDSTDGEAYRNAQKMKVIAPILMLFGVAKTNPEGPEARIVRQLASIIDAEADPAVIGAPIYSAVLGMDDIRQVMGGIPAGNRDKVYAPSGMSEAEAAEFNRRIQRFDADPAAIAYARRWHEATGRFSTPLVTVHQTLDSLVPYSQSEAFGRIVAEAGNSANLVQYQVPGTKFPLPGGLEGYTHCGFSPAQNIAAFEAMRAWVEQGRRPGPDAVQ